MKKLISILLCVVMLACLAACGTDNTTQKNGSTASDEIKIPSISNPIVNNNITDSSDMMEIDSPVGKLYYPAKWQNDVRFTSSETQVDASFEDVPLFTIYFNGDQGEYYGTLERNGEEVTLRYKMYDMDVEAEKFETMSAMQDDINVIFYYLTEGK